MRFYTGQHKHYCGIDLHARSMYLCILDQAGEVLLHKDYRANPEAFLKAVANYREDLVVSVECFFTSYWLADLCRNEGIHFVLGHALYMKAIHYEIHDILVQKHGKGKALTVLAHKLARAACHIWKHDTVFDQEKFLTH